MCLVVTFVTFSQQFSVFTCVSALFYTASGLSSFCIWTFLLEFPLPTFCCLHLGYWILSISPSLKLSSCSSFLPASVSKCGCTPFLQTTTLTRSSVISNKETSRCDNIKCVFCWKSISLEWLQPAPKYTADGFVVCLYWLSDNHSLFGQGVTA